MQPAHGTKPARIRGALDIAQATADLAIPAFCWHVLKGDPAGYLSSWDNGHWSLTFGCIGQDIGLVDSQDYHWRNFPMAKSPPYPREIIREGVLTELKPIVAEAALRIGVFRVGLSRVINRHAGIDPNLAVRLERAGAGTARGWLAIQRDYDLARELENNTHGVKPLDAA